MRLLQLLGVGIACGGLVTCSSPPTPALVHKSFEHTTFSHYTDRVELRVNETNETYRVSQPLYTLITDHMTEEEKQLAALSSGLPVILKRADVNGDYYINGIDASIILFSPVIQKDLKDTVNKYLPNRF